MFQADIYNPDEFGPAIQGCQVVFHVATPLQHDASSSQVPILEPLEKKKNGKKNYNVAAGLMMLSFKINEAKTEFPYSNMKKFSSLERFVEDIVLISRGEEPKLVSLMPQMYAIQIHSFSDAS